MQIQSIPFLFDDLFQNSKANTIGLENQRSIYLQGLAGSSKVLTVGQLFNRAPQDFLCILKDKEWIQVAFKVNFNWSITILIPRSFSGVDLMLHKNANIWTKNIGSGILIGYYIYEYVS